MPLSLCRPVHIGSIFSCFQLYWRCGLVHNIVSHKMFWMVCQVELVEPPEGVPLGESVVVAGFEGEPDEVLPPKKKIFESVKPDLATNSELVACYKGVPLSTSKGVCTVKSIAGGSIG